MDTINDKGMSMETSIKNKLVKLPGSGLNGKSFFPFNEVVKGGDTYVPEVKDALMLAETYFDNKTKEPIKLSNKLLKDTPGLNQPPINWYMSEKFDGQRALWDGSKFISRGTRVYPYVPTWFIALMPPGVALDGEFFTERNSFQDLGFLRSKLKPTRKKCDLSMMDLDKKWNNIKYQVFDLISDSVFEKRQIVLKNIITTRCNLWKDIIIPPYLTKSSCPLLLTKQILIKSEDQMFSYYRSLRDSEAEGLMIRAPGVKYTPGRTKLILKLKPEEDAECKIIGYKPGEGKYQGMLGSFECKNKDHTFYVSGMDDSIRSNYLTTHPVGTIISYKYSFLTDSGLPRHPRYFRIRENI
jgi:DNA ligase-1